MRTALRVAVLSLLTPLAYGCGADGNALGLGGDYLGTLSSDFSGTFTTYGVSTSTSDMTGSSEGTVVLTIEASYADADAVLYGLAGCPILLVASSGALVLGDKVECASETASSFDGATSDYASEETSSTNITDVTIDKSGASGIKLSAEADGENSKEENGEKVSDTSVRVDFSFEGERIASE